MNTQQRFYVFGCLCIRTQNFAVFVYVHRSVRQSGSYFGSNCSLIRFSFCFCTLESLLLQIFHRRKFGFGLLSLPPGSEKPVELNKTADEVPLGFSPLLLPHSRYVSLVSRNISPFFRPVLLLSALLSLVRLFPHVHNTCVDDSPWCV